MDRETNAVSLLLMYESCLSGNAGRFPAPPHGCLRRAAESKWAPYIRILPHNFTAPFFWTQDQLRELAGSQVDPSIRPSIH
jgi:hypothetical protein